MMTMVVMAMKMQELIVMVMVRLHQMGSPSMMMVVRLVRLRHVDSPFFVCW